MENKKYYTPDIEDLFIGYEYEQFSHLEGKWSDRILDYNHFITILDEEKNDWSEHHIRVPFLTREQIENEGWIYNEAGDIFKKDKYMLYSGDIESRYHPTLKNQLIIREESWYPEETKFFGRCPSINEFRKIIKLLGIDGK